MFETTKNGRIALIFVILMAPVFAGVSLTAGTDQEAAAQAIIAIEKEILTRWGKGDPFGYVDHAAPEVTAFDPPLEKKLKGIQALKDFLAPIKGQISVPRFEMQNLSVQVYGEVGVLTYNLVNYDKEDNVISRWNSTEVYRYIEGKWRLAHSHWSLTQPHLIFGKKHEKKES